MFIAFNQDPARQFATIQRRLDDELMVDYITPVGGGYYFVPRGPRSAADWIGSPLA
jgi:deferrochelatase/peroxidase EfeB